MYHKERTVCHQLSQQPDTYQLLLTMLAASSVRIDNPFLLVRRLPPCGGPGLVSGPAGGRGHGPEGGRHFPPFVHGSVAPNFSRRARRDRRARRARRALILRSQGEMKHSESGILLLQNGVHRVAASIQHSLVF